MELCAVQLKVEQLDAELQDLSSQESKDEASLSKTKKTLRDLEAKVKDQEEELDEQAGTIQMLEQVQSYIHTHTETHTLVHTHADAHTHTPLRMTLIYTLSLCCAG